MVKKGQNLVKVVFRWPLNPTNYDFWKSLQICFCHSSFFLSDLWMPPIDSSLFKYTSLKKHHHNICSNFRIKENLTHKSRLVFNKSYCKVIRLQGKKSCSKSGKTKICKLANFSFDFIGLFPFRHNDNKHKIQIWIFWCFGLDYNVDVGNKGFLIKAVWHKKSVYSAHKKITTIINILTFCYGRMTQFESETYFNKRGRQKGWK